MMEFELKEEFKVPHDALEQQDRKQASNPLIMVGHINESDIFAIGPGTYGSAAVEAESIPRAQELLELEMDEDTLIEDFGDV